MVVFILVVGFFLLYSYSKRRIKIKNTYLPIKAENLNSNELEFLRLVNEHRINLGLNPLIAEKLACEICENQLDNDIKENVLGSHFYWYTMITNSNAKEGSHIVANNFATPLSLFNGYMSSEGHKSALENKNRTHIGTSFKENRNHTIILIYAVR